MIGRILEKWKQNWPFLLAVTVALTLVAGLTPIRTHPNMLAELPIHLRVLGWPFLNILRALMDGFPEKVSLLLLPPILWSAFLWAVVLLELKQVLARTKSRRQRTEQ